jgi:phosphatidylserine/phosphatidylglycerophosphate/cardiolipin synthase-like enzyme
VLGKARRNIDVAMNAFTDKEIAELLASKERQGVRVRVYRDAGQYAQEESSAYGHETTSAILKAAGVDVRVKASGELMRLRSYAVDDSFIRTGSAEWSPAGLEDQDNDVFYIQSPDAVTAFSADFEALWNRSDNLVVARP